MTEPIKNKGKKTRGVHMKEVQEFFKKNGVLSTLLLLVIMQFFGLSPDTFTDNQLIDGGTNELIAQALEPVIEKVVEEKLGEFEEKLGEFEGRMNERFDDIEMAAFESDINELAIALKDIRTMDQLREKIDYWDVEGWSKKFAAITHVSTDPRAVARLKDKLFFFSDEMFQYLMDQA